MQKTRSHIKQGNGSIQKPIQQLLSAPKLRLCIMVHDTSEELGSTLRPFEMLASQIWKKEIKNDIFYSLQKISHFIVTKINNKKIQIAYTINGNVNV